MCRWSEWSSIARARGWEGFFFPVEKKQRLYLNPTCPVAATHSGLFPDPVGVKIGQCSLINSSLYNHWRSAWINRGCRKRLLLFWFRRPDLKHDVCSCIFPFRKHFLRLDTQTLYQYVTEEYISLKWQALITASSQQKELNDKES